MIARRRQRIVVLGLMSRMPVGGLVWATMQYLVGFARLGYDVHYVEAHGCTPRMFIEHKGDDGWLKGAAFVAGVMRRFDLPDRWAYHVLHDGRCFGMSREQLRELYRSSDFIINLHGSTTPSAEQCAGGRLIYVDTDPVELQVDLHQRQPKAIAVLEAHHANVTWGLNYGRPDSRVPVSDRFMFHASPPPIVPDLWTVSDVAPSPVFTTIGNWRQEYRECTFEGERYFWSKHHEFLKLIDLPLRTNAPFELALSSYDESDRTLLERHGWRVRDALSFSTDLEAYRDYIRASHGEFTVAKDQNVRLRSGWFSERSATYLASGRPVVTQDTGFSNVLPTGTGLFAFNSIDEILDAVDNIAADYPRHSKAAAAIATEFFDYRVVLPRLLSHVHGG